MFLPKNKQHEAMVIEGKPLVGRPVKQLSMQPIPWMHLISTDTIRTEVTDTIAELEVELAKDANSFRGGEHRSVRKQFAKLSLLFGIVHNYEKKLTWQEQARQASIHFNATAYTCRTGTLQVRDQAIKSLGLLRNFVIDNHKTDFRIGGPCISLPNRSLLMNIQEEEIQKITSGIQNPDDLVKKSVGLKRSAQLIGSIAQLLSWQGMDDANDKEYVKHAGETVAYAHAFAKAAAISEHKVSATAFSKLKNSCTKCHAEYR